MSSDTVHGFETTDTVMQTPIPVTTGAVIAQYSTYEPAQRLVDGLSDAGFPVQHVRIVGSDLRSVEQVTGRFTTGRAALSGAAGGAWFGLLIGLLIGLFAPIGGWFGLVLTGLVVGALWGGLFGAVAQWATRGRRDFASVQLTVARKYTVEVDEPYAADALRLAATV